ncbi:rho-associated protein kinase 1 [Senna tora]|uniref:Rho-associated protein kinase 1 n=1 Tax=Senna tora TaxID=362788 RepID=A0A834T9L3_9FABA|nr:rho-associated protein kinase 1 [Senna tora]
MMASKGDEDMDSLFEGMVLFNASQIQENPPPDNRQDDLTGDCLQYRQNDFSASSTIVSSSSQPLDENLFSDLTLVTPLHNSEVAEAEILLQSQSRQPSAGENASIVAAAAAAATATTTRQSSRRKKRAGLRIGYGRDNLLSNDLPHPPSPQPQHPLSISSCLSSETLDVFQHDKASSVGDTFPLHPSKIITDAVVTASAGESSSLSDDSKSEIKDSWNRKDEENFQEGNFYDDSFSEAEFLQIKDRIYEKLNRARQLVASLSAVRKDSIRNRRKAVNNANLASLKHMELEKQLEEACEAEDFERAERVSQDLSDAEKEKQGFMNSLREADALIDSVDFKMQQALDSQMAAEEECAILLEQFAKKAANDADFTLKKAASMYSIEMDKWLSSSESLEVKKMELEIESQFLSGARLELNNNIEHLIQDDKREKEILCKRKDILLDELEQLLALVKQKEMEIADNDSNINAVEKNISNVVSGFQEIQSSIDVKYDNLHSVLAQVNIEMETLFLRKKKIDDFLNQEEEKGAKLMELARSSEKEAKGFHEVVDLRKSLMSSTLKSREEKVSLANNEEKLSGDVKLFRQKVFAARASLQELSSRKSSIQQDIASFKQRIIFIDKRVPELEAEKKVATAARNFKEAARIAAEAKSLCVEKEGMQTNLGTTTSNLEKLEKEIKDTLKQLQETEEMILLKEKELAMARFQKLLLTARTARAEKTAALEMGDVEEADLLLAEAEAADSEAEKLQSAYDFKAEDFTSLPNYVISIDLVSYLGRKQLSELAVTLHQSSG